MPVCMSIVHQPCLHTQVEQESAHTDLRLLRHELQEMKAKAEDAAHKAVSNAHVADEMSLAVATEARLVQAAEHKFSELMTDYEKLANRQHSVEAFVQQVLDSRRRVVARVIAQWVCLLVGNTFSAWQDAAQASRLRRQRQLKVARRLMQLQRAVAVDTWQWVVAMRQRMWMVMRRAMAFWKNRLAAKCFVTWFESHRKQMWISIGTP